MQTQVSERGYKGRKWEATRLIGNHGSTVVVVVVLVVLAGVRMPSDLVRRAACFGLSSTRGNPGASSSAQMSSTRSKQQEQTKHGAQCRPLV